MIRMPISAIAALLSGAGVAHAQVTIDWVLVDNQGNNADPLNAAQVPGIGAVGYEYRIGKFEITNAQYAAFLNAVAASDPNELYSLSMTVQPRGGITRAGAPGSYTYATKPNMADKPVVFVDWFDAARFCNWLTNGQGAGDTEAGVYTFNGVQSISAITRDLANPSQVFLPTENEWYKAAYHQPAAEGGDGDDYWLHATGENSLPTAANADTTGDIANPSQDTVNFVSAADWNGLNGNVTTVGSAGSETFYGAFDMAGNVREWTETTFNGERVSRGGQWNSPPGGIWSRERSVDGPLGDRNVIGFRLAAPAAADCPADITGPAQDGIPDSTVDAADLTLYLDAYITQFNTAGGGGPNGFNADLTGPAQDGIPDAVVDASDLTFYLDAYVAAFGPCP